MESSTTARMVNKQGAGKEISRKYTSIAVVMYANCLFLSYSVLCLISSRLAIGVTAETYNISCGPRQEYKNCERCERTCSNLKPVCINTCSTGCFCNDPFVKAPNGQCVELKECPQAEVTMGVQDIGIEDCASDEEFLSCGWCEPSCSDPEPLCSSQTCTRGCLCRPPLVRHYSGQCVERKNCLPQACIDVNEEYACRYGCEARCDNRTCIRPRRCSLGCHCKIGRLRDVTGQCVTPNKCIQHPSRLLNGSAIKSIKF